MVLQGPPPPVGGSQPASPSLLRSSNNVMPTQNAFPSSVSPRTHFNSMNMIGNNGPNVSPLFDQSFGNGAPSSGTESVPLSSAGNGMGFITPSSPYMSSSIAVNPYSSGQIQGQGQGQQFPSPSEQQNFQHNQQQFSMPTISQQQQQSQQYQVMRPGLGGVGAIKMGQQTSNDQSSQQLQALRNIGSSVKMEPQQLQSMRGLGPAKLEPQYSDSSLFLHQQQQHKQQQLLLARQSPQAAAIFHQQRYMQMQQQQQQQLFKAMPQQTPQQFQQQNLPIRSPAKPVYEPGTCARRLTHYMYRQQHRPEDNNIDYWRTFVAEFFAPNAKKKWCVSMYGNGRQTNGVFPQDVWHCEICNRKPARGFEATAEVLPRLFKIKYESGTLEELLYVDMPREYQNSAGQVVLDYAKAIQESVFDQLRVVRDGQLRIVFSPDLKICSWEFCARRHEELIPRRLLIPQVSQLGAAAQKYQASTQNTSPGPSTSELQNNCNMFVASARQLAKSLEVPLVNDLGYTKRYVRCLQISEVVNNLKDLIDYSSETGAGPMESLAKYPRRTNTSPSSFRGQTQQPDIQQQQQTNQIPNNDNPIPPTNANNPINSPPTNTAPNLLHQNSINSRPQNQPNPSYGGNGVPNPSSNNNNIPKPASHTTLPLPSRVNSPNITMQQQPQPQPASGDVNGDVNDTQSSVEKIIQDMMMSSQLGGDARNGNGIMSGNGNNIGVNGGSNILMGTGVVNGHGQPPPMLNDIRSAFVNNHSVSMNGRAAGMNSQQQQDMSHQLLDGGIGAVNGFNSLQFDWKSSP